MNDTNVMTPKHPRWVEFEKRLTGPEGCNFRERESDGKTVWNCAGGSDTTKARQILADMGCDVERSIEFFRQHGGHCDCEILFNVG